MTVSVCVPVSTCPRTYLRKYTSDLYQILVHVTYGRGSVLLWRRRHMLCTSGFMDDVILANKLRHLSVAPQPTCSLGLGYKRRVGIPVAGQWTRITGLLFGRRGLGPATCTRPQWVC